MSREFLDVFNSLNLKSGDLPFFEGVSVERLSATPAGDLLRVYIESDHVIAKKLIMDAENSIKTTCFPDKDIEIKIYEHYTLSDLYSPENLYEEYKDSIELELCDYRHLYKNILSDAEFDFSDPGHLSVTLAATVMAEEWSSELERILDKIFNERFGFRLVVDIVLQEKIRENTVTSLRDMQVKQRVAEIVTNSSLNPHKGEELVLAQEAPDGQTVERSATETLVMEKEKTDVKTGQDRQKTKRMGRPLQIW